MNEDLSKITTKDLIARLRALKESAKYGLAYETARESAKPILAELNFRLNTLEKRLKKSVRRFKWSTRLS